jgi:2-keto-4-pentenoate hydratase
MNPSDQKITAIIDDLIGHRKNGTKFSSLPQMAPDSIEEAYLWQDVLIAKMASPVRGWKVGATSAVGQKALGVDQPVAGPLFDNVIQASGSDCKLVPDSMGITESEFAFQMRNTLPRQDGDYTIEDIMPHIAGVAPALEIVDTRFMSGFGPGIAWIIADGTGNHGFIHGTVVENIERIDFPAHQVRLMKDGNEVATGNGAAVLGNPLNVIVWLANHLTARGIGLKAGDWISTGLTTDVVHGHKGDRMRADFGEMGSVETRFV